jgi:hypothetical protein
VKLNAFPKTPSDIEWDRFIDEARKQNKVLVQVSERKYIIGELRYIRHSNDPFVIPWVSVDLKKGERYTWLKGLDAMVQLLRKVLSSSGKPDPASDRSS